MPSHRREKLAGPQNDFLSCIHHFPGPINDTRWFVTSCNKNTFCRLMLTELSKYKAIAFGRTSFSWY